VRALVAALLLVLAAGCRWEEPLAWPARTPGDRHGGVLRLAAPDDVPSLDPALAYDSRSWFFQQHLFETLLTYDDANQLVPGLAHAWTVSDDLRRFELALRPGVVFSDGSPVTAADFVGSLERVLDPKTRSQGAEYYRRIRGAKAYQAGAAPHVAGLVAAGPHAVRIELEAPDPIFLHKLALLFAAVVPAERARTLGDDFGDQPIGSGPFVLREWRRGERIVLARNPRYRIPELPYLDGVVQEIGVSPELAWLMYEGDELDVVGIPPADFPTVRRDPARQDLLIHATTLWTGYIGLNCQMPPLDDRRVRQALNYAVDKAGVVSLLNGRATPAEGIVPPNMPGYAPVRGGYPHDPARARRLLAAAGHADGFATELWTQGTDTDVKIAQKLQQDFAAINVRMGIKQVAWSTFLEAIRQPRTVPLFDLGWSADFPDPSNFLEVLFHSNRWDANNHSFYANPRVDRLLERAAREGDQERRYRLYTAVERRIVRDAPVIFLYHPVAWVIRQPRVHGYRIHDLLPARVPAVWLEPAPVR
jgi:peptide/nickel transport system substrate-binding protein/oligopeptide transport system substrate-binding protein